MNGQSKRICLTTSINFTNDNSTRPFSRYINLEITRDNLQPAVNHSTIENIQRPIEPPSDTSLSFIPNDDHSIENRRFETNQPTESSLTVETGHSNASGLISIEEPTSLSPLQSPTLIDINNLTDSGINMGFDIDRFVDTVNDDLLCSICRDVLQDPVQAPCEHAFCSTCIEGWLVHESTCPEDRQPLLSSQLRPIFRYMRNHLNRLQVRCSNIERGCTSVVSLENLNSHEETCGFNEVLCQNRGCDVKLLKKDLKTHMEDSCEFKTRLCPRGCGFPVPNTDSEDIASDHSCIEELKRCITGINNEYSIKFTDQSREMDLRLDAQRRYMVSKEEVFQNSVDALKLQVTHISQELSMLQFADRQRRSEFECLQKENKELVDKISELRSQQNEQACLIASGDEQMESLSSSVQEISKSMQQLETENSELKVTNTLLKFSKSRKIRMIKYQESVNRKKIQQN